MNLDAITRFAADGILNSLLAGLAIALLAGAVTRLFGRQGSGTRFAVWFLALTAIGVLPFVGHFAHASHGIPKLSTVSAITLPQSFATYLFIAWMIGAILGLLHVTHGLYRLRRLRATCTPVDLDQLDTTTRAILHQLGAPPLSPSVGDRVGIHRRVTLCTSNAVRVPAAIGYFRPMVVFPTWAFIELPTAEFNAILLHELAHLRRWDDFTNLAQKIAKAIFFFHPAVWFIESRLTLEREMACDDAVLAASFSPRAYAESLVDLAEKSFLRRGVQLAQAAVSHVQQLKLRLAEILRKDRTNDNKGQGSHVWKPAVALMSLVGIISAYSVAHAPRLIAFSADVPKLAAASMSTPHTISNEADIRLTPVNLRYIEATQSTTPSSRKVPSVHVRCQHRAVLTPPVNLTRRAYIAGLNAEVNDAPPPALLLSRGSMEFAPAPVLVVFQGQQFGADGPIFWRVTIVHLTPAQQRAITGEIAKQI
jgi:beta-lactamase regulating signal transducer with metallopeptidase domain